MRGSHTARLQDLHGRTHHIAGKSAPSAVDGSDGSVVIAHYGHREAVRTQCEHCNVISIADDGIRDRIASGTRSSRDVVIDNDDVASVHR